MIEDKHILALHRREPVDWIGSDDISWSGDVWSIVPMLYFLSAGIQAKTIVEIGVADGSTTLPLLKTVSETKGILHSVDAHEELSALTNLVNNSKCREYWKYYSEGSNKFFEGFKEEIDFAFIDGDHSWVQVAKDVRNCIKHLSNKGLIFVSDWGVSPGFRAVDNKIEEFTIADDTDEKKCSGGINKGVKCVLLDYPELNAVCISDRNNSSVLIGWNAIGRINYSK